MSERLTTPRDRDAILTDYAELTGYGVAPVDAARRLGVTEANESLSLDHIHPHSRGGSDQPENLQTLCRSCNSKKGARL